MAGGKETPRQKMIGMMYLVLTALLALNVSKQILDAFIAIELNISKGAITQKENGDRVINDMQKSISDAKLEQVQKDKIKIFLGVIKN
jgi:TorA maturation chaperone TorD